MQYGSALEAGRYSFSTCHHLQGLTLNTEQVGEYSGGAAVLSTPTSICGTSHRQGRK